MSENKPARVHDCDILELDRHHSRRKGDLSVITGADTVPFEVRRVYYLYDVPEDRHVADMPTATSTNS